MSARRIDAPELGDLASAARSRGFATVADGYAPDEVDAYLADLALLLEAPRTAEDTDALRRVLARARATAFPTEPRGYDRRSVDGFVGELTRDVELALRREAAPPLRAAPPSISPDGRTAIDAHLDPHDLELLRRRPPAPPRRLDPLDGDFSNGATDGRRFRDAEPPEPDPDDDIAGVIAAARAAASRLTAEAQAEDGAGRPASEDPGRWLDIEPTRFAALRADPPSAQRPPTAPRSGRGEAAATLGDGTDVLAAARQSAEAIVADAERRAADTVAAADRERDLAAAEARATLARARAEAGEIVTRAHERAAGLGADHHERRALLEERRQQILTELRRLVGRLEDLHP